MLPALASGFDDTFLSSDGGLVASNQSALAGNLSVAPSIQDEANTVQGSIFPIACFRLDDLRFGFDSSFITPETKAELTLLAELRRKHPNSPLSIFGHADPVNNDEYNKQLSGRRAMAIYALLTRDTNMWEELFSHPVGGDNWGDKSLILMVAETQQTDESSADIAPFRQNKAKRKQLFSDYMDALCGPELKIEKSEFLGEGLDSGGKGDFQGCSELNPLLIFSEKQQRKFAADSNHSERNESNAPNRRVMVLLFRPGSRILLSRWPCPRAKESVAPCRKRFWSDGEVRRSRREPDEERRFENTKDTFACRFYQRLTSQSPCEGIILPIVHIRLFDVSGDRIMNAPFEVTGPGVAEQGTAPAGDIVLRNVTAPSTVRVRWGRPMSVRKPSRLNKEKVLDPFEYEQEVHIDTKGASDEDAAMKRMENLGFGALLILEERVTSFQLACGREPTGRLADAKAEIKSRHERCDPPRGQV